MRKIFFCIVSVLLFVSVSLSKLNKTYPTSATTNLRMETYVDEASTIANSSWTIRQSTWTYFGSTRTYTNGNHYIFGSYSVDGSTWNIKQTSWTYNSYIDMVLEEAMNMWITEVLDKDIEQYLVYPATTCPEGWQGFCFQLINGTTIYKNCP